MDYGVAPDYRHSEVIRERGLLYLRLRWANLLALMVISVFGVASSQQSSRSITLCIIALAAILNLLLYAYVKLTKKTTRT